MSLKVVCVDRCFDNALFKSYFEDEAYTLDDEVALRYEEIGFLKHFRTPEGKAVVITDPTEPEQPAG